MTNSDPAGEPVFLKTDAAGRVRTTRKQREALLDAFEAGGLSGPEFARVHGLKYQTFASWRQKRRRERGEYPDRPPTKAAGENFTLIEATAESSSFESAGETPAGVLTVELPGGASMKIADSSDVRLAVEVLKTLNA